MCFTMVAMTEPGNCEGTCQVASTNVPYKQEDVLCCEGLRAAIFHAFRSNAGSRDWWCQLDADEIYIDDPRIFLAKVPDRFQTVWSASFQYYSPEQIERLLAIRRRTFVAFMHESLPNWSATITAAPRVPHMQGTAQSITSATTCVYIAST
jgi:hypothetical protein